MTDLFAAETAPFAAAIALMLMIAAAEAAGLLFGVSPAGALDQAFPDLGAEAAPDGGGEAGPGGLLAWLGVGRAPLLVLLIVFLTAFGVAGFALQGLARAAFGGPLPLIAAIPAALIAAGPASGAIVRLARRVLPRGGSEAVSAESFIGRVATVLAGEARSGAPAEARVKDAYGQTHYVRVEPDVETEIFEKGAEALIVSRKGSVYRAVRNPSAALSPASRA